MTRPYGKVRVVGILGAEPSKVVVHASLLVADEAGVHYQFSARCMTNDLKPYSPKQEISFREWCAALNRPNYHHTSTLDSEWLDAAYRAGLSVEEAYALCLAWDEAVYHNKFSYGGAKARFKKTWKDANE